MVEYYRVFPKRIKHLHPDPQLSDFCSPSESQQNGKMVNYYLLHLLGLTTMTQAIITLQQQ